MTEETRPPSNRLKQMRILLWALVALALVGVAVSLLRGAPSGPQATETKLVPATFGGPFTLVDGDGKPFPSSKLDGKPYAIFFGFTHCPDVCPTTLARLVKLRQQSGGADAFNIVFVSIDPERDGAKEVGEYATLFNAPIIALTGSPEQIDQVKKAYGIFAEKAAPAGGHAGHDGYMMNHTSTVLLFDKDGNFRSTIAQDEQDQAALAKLGNIAA